MRDKVGDFLDTLRGRFRALLVIFLIALLSGCAGAEEPQSIPAPPPPDKKVNRLWIMGAIHSHVLAKALDEYGSEKVVSNMYGHPDTPEHEEIPFARSHYEVLIASQVIIEHENGEHHVETNQSKWDFTGQHSQDKTLDMLQLNSRTFDVEWCLGEEEPILAADFGSAYMRGSEGRFGTREEYTEDIIEYVNCGAE